MPTHRGRKEGRKEVREGCESADCLLACPGANHDDDDDDDSNGGDGGLKRDSD